VKTDRCSSCNALVVFAQNPKTLITMPIDANPVAGGNIRLTERVGGLPLAEVVSRTLAFGRTDLRLSHFATCPNAAAHRKRGAA